MGIVIGILFIHWVADFVLQTDEQALNKSKSLEVLLNHTLTYSLCFIVLLTPLIWFLSNHSLVNCFKYSVVYSTVTLVFHTIQDYFTSKINAKLYSENKRHLFFVSIGFDQFLHYVQLFLTFELLNLLQKIAQ